MIYCILFSLLPALSAGQTTSGPIYVFSSFSPSSAPLLGSSRPTSSFKLLGSSQFLGSSRFLGPIQRLGSVRLHRSPQYISSSRFLGSSYRLRLSRPVASPRLFRQSALAMMDMGYMFIPDALMPMNNMAQSMDAQMMESIRSLNNRIFGRRRRPPCRRPRPRPRRRPACRGAQCNQNGNLKPPEAPSSYSQVRRLFFTNRCPRYRRPGRPRSTTRRPRSFSLR